MLLVVVEKYEKTNENNKKKLPIIAQINISKTASKPFSPLVVRRRALKADNVIISKKKINITFDSAQIKPQPEVTEKKLKTNIKTDLEKSLVKKPLKRIVNAQNPDKKKTRSSCDANVKKIIINNKLKNEKKKIEETDFITDRAK